MPSTNDSKTALIIGASRGLGNGLATEYVKRGWHVVGTVRSSTHGPLQDLQRTAGDALQIETVDINEPSQVSALASRLKGRTFDLLFVNAGVSNGAQDSVAKVSTDDFVHIMVTNALSPMRVVEALEPLVTPTGTIGLMTSGLGSVANNTSGEYEVYRASKAALNTLMRSFAARHAKGTRTLLLMHPGWVRTDMGGPNASLGVEESVTKIVDTMTAQQGVRGLQFLDYKGDDIAW